MPDVSRQVVYFLFPNLSSHNEYSTPTDGLYTLGCRYSSSESLRSWYFIGQWGENLHNKVW
jgi:hypothetical protein